MINVLEEVVRINKYIVLHCRINWDCVLIDLEELGGKEFLVLTNQYNVEIFFLFPPPFAIVLFHISSDQS